MKKVVAFLLGIVLVVAAAGCLGNKNTNSSTVTGGTPAPQTSGTVSESPATTGGSTATAVVTTSTTSTPWWYNNPLKSYLPSTVTGSLYTYVMKNMHPVTQLSDNIHTIYFINGKIIKINVYTLYGTNTNGETTTSLVTNSWTTYFRFVGDNTYVFTGPSITKITSNGQVYATLITTSWTTMYPFSIVNILSSASNGTVVFLMKLPDYGLPLTFTGYANGKEFYGYATAVGLGADYITISACCPMRH